MDNKTTPLEQLKSFLNQLFQFESQDLDFGVYKILHYKKKEIANFIDQLLVDKVKTELQTLSADEVKQVQDQIAEMEKSTSLKKWLEAIEKKDETRLAIYEEDYKNEIAQYKELKAKATESSVSVETENQIYNHLTLFFSRYYDKGDFISKRRFGKNEKYVVPYNGEETHFHWANQDQYYIKSSETFNHYAFKVQTIDGNLVVNFKLHNAQMEQGDVKADEPNFFMLADKDPEIKEKDKSELNFVLANKQPDVSENEITIYFEYRPLAEDEKNKVKGNSKQDTLDEIAFDFLKKEFGTNPVFANLWKEQEGKPILLKKLQHYTRKNKHDFFIHKNLKGFLERELDYYIKSELVNVDDLYVTDTDTHFDRLKRNLKTIKVFKAIADTIIDFVSQIEDFQKKLWEKKKFVLSTEWVITIDRLVKYVGEESAKPILEEVIKNERQVAEWEAYNLVQEAPTYDSLRSQGKWLKLSIDSIYFDSNFKQLLLTALSGSIDISYKIDGLVINSDNYHGINHILDTDQKSIQCIHIDPPYNTATSGFVYKNAYKNSSWLSMMDNRLRLSLDLLKDTASYHVHIDENEYESLHYLFNNYNLYNAGPIIWDKRNPMNGGSGVATQHEYIIWRTVDNHIIFVRNKNTLEMIKKVEELIQAEGGINESVRKKFSSWVNSNKSLSGGEQSYRFIDAEGRIYRGISLRAPERRIDEKFHQPLIHPITKRPCAMPPNGFSRTPETLKDMMENGEILFGKDETTQPQWKKILTKKSQKQFSSLIQDGKKGKADIKHMGFEFPYCHPTSLYEELIGSSEVADGDVVLDFFAGSGTTFHTIQNLNREDNLKRKCILIEQGHYTTTTIIPRIKKIAYTFDWKEGKPKDDSMNGLGVFFKYQRLEQYEEALENIAFNASEDAVQKSLEFDQYIPKYFLEFETKSSQTLVNTAAMKDPWNYQLKVWDGFTYDTEQAVDLVETFNYLIGLHMQKCITKELNDKKYQFIYGQNNENKKILVVWRSVKDWDLEDYMADAAALKTELKVFVYDLLYINDQASLGEEYGYQPIEEVFKNKMLP